MFGGVKRPLGDWHCLDKVLLLTKLICKGISCVIPRDWHPANIFHVRETHQYTVPSAMSYGPRKVNSIGMYPSEPSVSQQIDPDKHTCTLDF